MVFVLCVGADGFEIQEEAWNRRWDGDGMTLRLRQPGRVDMVPYLGMRLLTGLG